MCFTIEIKLSREALEKRFNADASILSDFEFRYFYRAFDNPLIPVISQASPSKIELMRWGLIPHWAKDQEHANKIRRGTYNARSETLEEKSSFKRAFQQSRCWILVNGFFEWQHIGKDKIPWYIQMENSRPFALAGIYDTWTNPQTFVEEKTVSIVTTHANPLMERIHNTKKRMPVILSEANEKQWITKGIATADHTSLLLPLEEDTMKAHRVSKTLGTKSADPNDKKIIIQYDYYQSNTLFE